MNTKELPKTLAGRMCLVMREMKNVPKNGKNTFHGYKYATESDVVDAVRDLLADAGVFCFQSDEDVSIVGERKTKSGAIEYVTQVKRKYTWINADDSADRIETIHYGTGIDGSDKGIYKALTGCHKYAILKTFNVGTGDDPENDDHRQAPPAPAQRQAPKPQPAPAPAPKAEVPFDDDLPGAPEIVRYDLSTLADKTRERYGCALLDLGGKLIELHTIEIDKGKLTADQQQKLASCLVTAANVTDAKAQLEALKAKRNAKEAA